MMERRDAQGAEAPQCAVWGRWWCSNEPRRKRATHTRASEEWHRLVLLEGPTRPKECKGLFCKAAAECSKKIKAFAAGADLAGSACRIVASVDVVQAATKVGWDWCDVVNELVCQLLGAKRLPEFVIPPFLRQRCASHGSLRRCSFEWPHAPNEGPTLSVN